MRTSIGERIREVRKIAKLTQKAFGNKLGISLPTVNRIENNQYQPSASLLSNIVETYGCSPGWLLVGELPLGSDQEGLIGAAIMKKIPLNFDKINPDLICGRLVFPGLPQNSYAFINREEGMFPSLRRGDLVVFSIEEAEPGELVLVRDQWGRGMVRRLGDREMSQLLAENPEYPPLYEGRDLVVVGKIADIVRKVDIE